MPRSVFTAAYRTLLAELRQARKAARLTQSTLGVRIGMSQTDVSKYESGERRLDVIEFLTISRALDTDPHRIMRTVERALSRSTKS